MIDYSPLWKTMKEKDISQYLLLKGGIDNKTLDVLKHNGNITVLTLEKICKICDCTPNEVLCFIDNPEETQSTTKAASDGKIASKPKSKSRAKSKATQ